MLVCTGNHKRPLSSSTRLFKAFSMPTSSFGGSTKTLVKKKSLHLRHLSTTVESGLPLPATAWPIEELIVSNALLLL